MSEKKKSQFVSSASLLPAGVLSAVLSLLASCNVFDPASDRLRCSVPVDCDAPRTCQEGFCVVPAAFLPDANPALPDARADIADAGPAAPDADPVAPDAGIPDANLPNPDAGPGECSPLTPTLALVDDFQDGVETPLWDVANGMNLTLAEAGGVLSVSNSSPPPSMRQAGYTSLLTNLVLRDSSFYLEVPAMISLSSNAAAAVRFGPDNFNMLEIKQEGGNMVATLRLADVPTVLASFPYSASAHRWWRVVDSGGNFDVQTSSDAALWVTHATAATPAFFDALEVDLRLVANGGGIAIGTVSFDNTNRGLVPCP